MTPSGRAAAKSSRCFTAARRMSQGANVPKELDKGSAQYDTCDQKPKAGLRKAPDLLRRALYHTIV